MKRTVIAATAGVALAGVIGIGVAGATTGSGPAGWVGDALSGLVSDGTLTQKQADAVAEALEDARDEARDERQQRWADRRAEVDAMLEETLGMTRAELREQLRAGKTLKEVAGNRAADLAEAAVALVEEHTKAAVSDGRITQEQATAMVQRAEDRAKAWLAGEDVGLGRGGLGLLLGGGKGPGMMGGPGGWHRGPGMGDRDDTDAADPTSA